MKKSISTFSYLLYIVFATFCCTPIILQHTSLYVGLSIVIVLFVTSNINNEGIQKNKGLLTGVILFMFINVFYKIAGISSASWGRVFMHLFSFLCFLIMPLVPTDVLDNKKSKRLWCCLVLLIVFNIADNIYLSIEYPEIHTSRYFIDQELLSSINAGGGAFYTFSLFAFNVFFFVFLKCKEKIVKYIMLGCAIVTAVFIVGYCFKASVVAYFILSVILQFVADKTKTKSNLIVVSIILMALVVLFIEVYQESVIRWIVSVSPNPRLTMRFVAMIDVDNAEASEMTITGRTDLYMLSLQTWLKNPINFFFGIGDHFVVTDVAATGIGQHADFLDTLGRFGLIGFAVICLIFIKSYKYIMSLFDKENHNNLIVIFLIYVFCGCTKNVFTTYVGCVLFMFLPMCSQFVNKNVQDNDNTCFYR